MSGTTPSGVTSPDCSLPEFYRELRNKLTFPLGWNDHITDKEKWKRQGLEKARECILWHTSKKDFAVSVLAEEQRESYSCRRIAITISDECRIPAYLLIPDKPEHRFPAVVLYHDHGGKFDIGKEKCIRPFNDQVRLASALRWAEKNYAGHFIGDDLAGQGYVVFCCDALGWGERSCEGYRGDSQQALASNLFNLGTSYASLIAEEDCRAVDYVASLPCVDSHRIVTAGFSMGGFRSWQTAALSDRVTAGICNCWMATLPGLMHKGNNQLKGQSAFTMTHPGLSRWLDYPDVAGLAVPKPLLFMAGAADHLFPVAAVQHAFQKIRNIYRSFGAEANLETRMFPDGHVFSLERQHAAGQWLHRLVSGSPFRPV